MEEVEKLLGRNLSLTEGMLFEMFKNNPEYQFEKDNNGNLIAVKK